MTSCSVISKIHVSLSAALDRFLAVAGAAGNSEFSLADLA